MSSLGEQINKPAKALGCCESIQARLLDAPILITKALQGVLKMMTCLNYSQQHGTIFLGHCVLYLLYLIYELKKK